MVEPQDEGSLCPLMTMWKVSACNEESSYPLYEENIYIYCAKQLEFGGLSIIATSIIPNLTETVGRWLCITGWWFIALLSLLSSLMHPVKLRLHYLELQTLAEVIFWD